MKRALIFPGQGSQFIGMGKDLYTTFSVAKEVFDEVDDALNQSLARLMFEGTEAELRLTENTQPALMAVSIASLRVLEKETGLNVKKLASFAAGHSLGEYSALAAVDALSLADTAKLLKIRGQAMQQAVPEGKGAMAAILGLDMGDIEKIISKTSDQQVCVVANDNCVGQVVISGTLGAVEDAIAMAGQYGAKRTVMLPVSAPFHCSLMASAADRMAEAFTKVAWHDPVLPVISNVTAELVSSYDSIKNLLVEQVTHKVRWRESVQKLKELGVEEVLELGAGQVLNGLVKRIEPELKRSSLGTVSSIASYIEQL